MSLFRCSNLLNRINVSVLPLKVHPIVYYSDKKSSSDEGVPPKPNAKETKEKAQERLKSLLGKLILDSNVKNERKIQTAKPLGYKKIVKTKFSNEKPKGSKKATDAAKAVAVELDDAKVEADMLHSVNTTPTDGQSKNLEFVFKVVFICI